MKRIKSYGDGGRTRALAPEDAAISKVLMERNRGKNFVDRAYDYQHQPSIQIPGQLYRSTHLMSYDTNSDGTGRVYPEVVQRNGNLQHLTGDNAWNYADSTGEYITTPSWKTADMLSNYGYKKATGIPTNQYGGTINDNNMKKKGYSIPGYERGGYASYENGNRGISKLGSIIDMATNNNMDYPNPIPHEHPVYRTQNGIMANGGYLGYMQSNPQGGGVMYTNGVRMHQNPQPHGGSNMNGSSWSKFGGNVDNQNFLPAPLEYAYLQQGGHVDRYSHGGYPYYDSSAYPYEDGGQVDNTPDEMKSGGIHINPANKGKFNATKAKTGKTTEELTHSSNPVTKKRAIFAQNASHWSHKKQYGGALRKFVDGGETIPPMEPTMPQPLPTPMPPSPGMPGAYAPPTIPQDQMPQAPPPVFNDESFRDDDRQPQRRQQPIGTGFNNLLGAGLMATSYFEDKRNARNAAGYQRQLGMSDNAFKSQELNTQGNRGNYDQHGNFRPNEMTPSNAGMYYPQRQYGGYQNGGYTQGQEVELHPEEIKRLQKLGYKIQIM